MGAKIEEAMAKMEQFEKEYTDSEYELDDRPEPAAETPPAEAAEGESEESVPETADQHAEPAGTAARTADGGEAPSGGEPEKAKTYPIPNDPETWGDMAGKRVTEEEFLKSGLVTKLLTREHQELYHMKKYQDEVPALRSELDELKKRLSAPPPKEKPQPKPITPELVEKFGQDLERTFLPQIQKFAEMGGIEEHLVTDAPRFLSTLEYRFQSGQKLMDVLTKGFAALAADWVERNKAEKASSARATLENAMLQIASNDGFGDLSNPDHRQEFGQWLAGQKAFAKMDVTELGGDDMEIAYMQYLRSRSKQGSAAPSKQPPPRRRTEAMLATGGGRGGSRGSSGNAPRTAIDSFLREVEEASRSRE